MRLSLLVLAVEILASCKQQPQRQPKLSDAQLQRIRVGEPGITDECLDKIKWGGIEAAPAETDRCYKMMPATRWRGLWRNDFEGSAFCPAPARECRYVTPDNSIWLSLPESSPYYRMEGRGGLYAVDIIGRRTAVRGHYGHMGMFDYEMIVDRLISIKEIEPPPKD